MTRGIDGGIRGALVVSFTPPTSGQRVQLTDEGIIEFSLRGGHRVSFVAKVFVRFV